MLFLASCSTIANKYDLIIKYNKNTYGKKFKRFNY